MPNQLVFTEEKHKKTDKSIYSQVPIKQVGPNKRVGWLFYVNLLNKYALIDEYGGGKS